MVIQGDLFTEEDFLPPPAPKTRHDQIRERFEKFHAENPQVWELFKKFTFQLIRVGHKHYSSDAIVQQIRWHTAVETVGEVTKVNDHYRAYYARMFHREFPEHDGFFRNRVQKSKDEAARENDVAFYDSGADPSNN